MVAPHFLLLAEASFSEEQRMGVWRFALNPLDRGEPLDASDRERSDSADRLELLAVVRGLEALDQPSQVTLVTRNYYISRSLRQHIDQWRENDWRWERFDRLAPVKNSDLWRRIDRARAFHQVDCRVWRFDEPTATGPPEPKFLRRRKITRNISEQPSPEEGAVASPANGWIRDVAAKLCRRSWRKLNSGEIASTD